MKPLNDEAKTTDEIVRDYCVIAKHIEDKRSNKLVDFIDIEPSIQYQMWRLVSVCEAREKEITKEIIELQRNIKELDDVCNMLKAKAKDDVQDAIEQEHRRILEWCYKNNTIPLKNNPNIHIAIADGGWINVIKLQEYLNSQSSPLKKEDNPLSQVSSGNPIETDYSNKQERSATETRSKAEGQDTLKDKEMKK